MLEQPSENKAQAVSSSGSEPEVVKRRGKKKKGKKSGGKDGEKEFQGFPEPGETQVRLVTAQAAICRSVNSLSLAGIRVKRRFADGQYKAIDNDGDRSR